MFENLDVYQKAVDFIDQITNLTEQFPRGYYFLTDRFNRAALSGMIRRPEQWVAPSEALCENALSPGMVGVLNGGVYIAVFHLPKARHIRIGRLGRAHFRQGMYFYVGTAQKNLSARLARHSRKEKTLRWHIDYLSVRAEMLGAILIPGPRRRECEVAEELAGMFEPAVPGFGASDCRCRGHLFYTPTA